MKNLSPLNDFQRGLVNDNISVVEFAIQKAIIVNNTVYGFEYDDLFQEGCLWLCKAAIYYNPEAKVKFSTFATTVVINGLRTYCRLTCNKQKKIVLMPDCNNGDTLLSLKELSYPDFAEMVISEIDTISLLQSFKQQYSGIIRKGIEALELKAKGYTGAEIARFYGVKPNHVGAWISKAMKKLKTNSMFIVWRDSDSEKLVS